MQQNTSFDCHCHTNHEKLSCTNVSLLYPILALVWFLDSGCAECPDPDNASNENRDYPADLVRDDLVWKEEYRDPTSDEYKEVARDSCKRVSTKRSPGTAVKG